MRLPFPPMPSGKRARQQRRTAATAAPPPVRSKGVGGARTRQASPRALAIAGGVVLVAVIAIVLGVVLGSGGSGGGSGIVTKKDLDGLGATGNATSPVALQGAPQANALFQGIPQKGLVVGKPTAPVEMQMFIDVQCPICKFYEINYLPTVVQKYIRAGKVQLHLQPWAFIGAQSDTGRLGVIAAGAQNKGYEYAKVLYDNQPDNSENSGWLDGRMLATIAASVTGLDLQRWRTDVNSAEAKSVAKSVDKLATKDKITGTPTVLVGRVNGPLHNVLTPAQIAANQSPTLQDTEHALDAALANS
jgi:protein-disulfide isomerase